MRIDFARPYPMRYVKLHKELIMRFVLSIIFFLSLLGSAYAADPNVGAFGPFMDQDGPHCVSVADVEKAAAEAKPVKETTFRFLQALYMAIPPMSRELPPGDKAELATDKDGVVIALLTDGPKSCARFLVPPFLFGAIMQVELGKTTHVGEGL